MQYLKHTPPYGLCYHTHNTSLLFLEYVDTYFGGNLDEYKGQIKNIHILGSSAIT